MIRRSRRDVRALAALGLATCILLAGCVSSEEESVAGSYPWDWALLAGATEVFTDDTVDGMAAHSDLVAVGSFTKDCEPRTMGEGPGGDNYTYGCLSFEPTRVLQGADSAIGESFPVEFLGTPDSESLPTGEVLVFLLDKDGDEAGRYRPVNSFGLWTSTTRAAVDQPMQESVPDSSALSDQNISSETWDSFVESIATYLGE